MPRAFAHAAGSKGQTSLAECIRAFQKREVLSEQDGWRCPRCAAPRRAVKQLQLWRLPQVLVFHLKRFAYTAFARDKLDTFVDFPVGKLDMAKYARQSDGGGSDDQAEQDGLEYELSSVVHHTGNLGGGHYTAVARHRETKEWCVDLPAYSMYLCALGMTNYHGLAGRRYLYDDQTVTRTEGEKY